MKKQPIKIMYWGDWNGMMGQGGPEEESLDCKRWFKYHIFEKEKFEFTLAEGPHEFDSLGYDILVFDFGGIGYGCSGFVDSLTRQLLKLIEDRPNTLFIAWTHFTNEFLKDACEEELGKFRNLISREYENEIVIKNVKKWLKENR